MTETQSQNRKTGYFWSLLHVPVKIRLELEHVMYIYKQKNIFLNQAKRQANTELKSRNHSAALIRDLKELKNK